MTAIDCTDCYLAIEIGDGVKRALVRHFATFIAAQLAARDMGMQAGEAPEKIDAEAWRLAVRVLREVRSEIDGALDETLLAPDPQKTVQDILAAAVEAAICDTLLDRTANAIAWFRREFPQGTALVAAGGVAANAALRRRLAELAAEAGLDFVAPPPALCTDNGAMVAWAGLERLRLGLSDGLDAPVRPRWPLDGGLG